MRRPAGPAHAQIGRAGGQPMETRGLVADYNAVTEPLTVWASSQVPHQVRQFICDLLGLPPHRVRVVAPDVGGGFGAKLIVYPEDVLIPFLALRFGRPVRWLEDRLEHMLTATQERTQVHDGGRRLRRRGPAARAARSLRARHRRLHPARPGGAAAQRLDAGRALSHPPRRGQLRERLHQSRAGDALSRRRAAAGGLRHRARHGPDRARDGPRPRGRAVHQSRAADAMPYDVGLPNYRAPAT